MSVEPKKTMEKGRTHQMASNINLVIMSGRFTRDPELMKTKTGIPVTLFSIAVNNPVKDGDGWVDSPTFVLTKAFGKNAEIICKRCSKGALVTIQGRITQEKYQKKDGANVDRLVVQADKIFFNEFGRKGTGNGYVDSPDAPASPVEVDEGDLPF